MLVCKDTIYVKESCYMKKTLYILCISTLLSVHNFCRRLEATVKESLGNQKA